MDRANAAVLRTYGHGDGEESRAQVLATCGEHLQRDDVADTDGTHAKVKELDLVDRNWPLDSDTVNFTV